MATPGRRRFAAGLAGEAGAVRFMFAAYLLVAIAGVVFYSVVGLIHH